MTRFARIAIALIAVAAVVVEVVVSWVYIDDPDTIFANVGILVYALIAVGAVLLVDRIVRVRRGQAPPLLSRFAKKVITLTIAAAVILEVVPGVDDGSSVFVLAATVGLLITIGDLLVGHVRRIAARIRGSHITNA